MIRVKIQEKRTHSTDRYHGKTDKKNMKKINYFFHCDTNTMLSPILVASWEKPRITSLSKSSSNQYQPLPLSELLLKRNSKTHNCH